MCGINGFTLSASHAEADVEVLQQMNQALEHRGPDDARTVIHGRCAMGVQRLAIVDVDNGRQPMQTSDGRFTTVFNGELYDYKHMRSELERAGVTFQTQSDTEVLLKSYTEYGIGALDQFNGMFAFAISDVQDGSVLLVRDQLGIKPLYYYHAPDGTLVFSSELGALVANPVVPRQLDHESLSMLLVDRFIDDPFTLFN